MSEHDRSRLYAWLREHADEPIAEYMMSCLSPAPLPDLVTKDDVAKLDAKVTALDTKVAKLDAKVDGLADRSADDRRAGRIRHFWLAGIGLSAAVPIWLSAAGVIG